MRDFDAPGKDLARLQVSVEVDSHASRAIQMHKRTLAEKSTRRATLCQDHDHVRICGTAKRRIGICNGAAKHRQIMCAAVADSQGRDKWRRSDPD